MWLQKKFFFPPQNIPRRLNTAPKKMEMVLIQWNDCPIILGKNTNLSFHLMHEFRNRKRNGGGGKKRKRKKSGLFFSHKWHFYMKGWNVRRDFMLNKSVYMDINKRSVLAFSRSSRQSNSDNRNFIKIIKLILLETFTIHVWKVIK